jgi:hypothetical protein
MQDYDTKKGFRDSDSVFFKVKDERAERDVSVRSQTLYAQAANWNLDSTASYKGWDPKFSITLNPSGKEVSLGAEYADLRCTSKACTTLML